MLAAGSPSPSVGRPPRANAAPSEEPRALAIVSSLGGTKTAERTATIIDALRPVTERVDHDGMAHLFPSPASKIAGRVRSLLPTNVGDRR